MINLLKEKHITNANVYVNGKKTEFVSLSLEQTLGEHHTFSVTLDYDKLKKSFLSNPKEQMELIGKPLDIDLQQGADSGNAYEFRGIICDIIHEGQEGKHGFLIIEGMSPTILLERGKRLDIFSNMDLKTVFQEVTAGAGSGLSCVNQPVYTGQLDFLMQYQESDWEFLKRLSAITGETLLYTGRDLVFGEHKEFKEIEVTYDKEITRFQFGAKLIPNHFSHYQYLPEKDEALKQNAPASVENSNEYIDTASEGAKEVTQKRPVYTPLAISVQDQGSLEEIVKREKISNASQTVYVKGTAKTCVARIGRLLTINMPIDMIGAKPLGTYRVVKVKHTIDQNNRYESEFEAVPASLKFLPVPEIKLPVAESILAKVIKNNDPKGLGRVVVEFPFAQDRVSNTWLRVMSPDAGSSGDVPQNRGLVFIPEVGDQVMVGFEFGDPNQPYVMGSMFHGKNGTGGGGSNATKSIFTRSGTQITFNDGQKSIHISDPSGNTWDMDGNGTISVNAPSCFKVNSGGSSLTMNASGEITISASTSVEIKVGETTTLSMKTSSIDVTSGQNTISGTNFITGGDTKIDKGNVTIEGTVVTIKGSPVNIN